MRARAKPRMHVLLPVAVGWALWPLQASAVGPDSQQPKQGRDTGAELRGEPAPDRVDGLVLSADMTYRWLDIRKLVVNDGAVAPTIVPTHAGGVSPGLGAGVRLWFVSLMLKGDVTFLDSGDAAALDRDLELWNLGLEVALRVAPRRIQPYVLFGAGFSALGGVDDLIDEAGRASDAKGVHLRGGLGLDYFLSRTVSLGARGQVDGLILASRVSALDLATPESVDTVRQARSRLREADGTLTALSYGLGANVALHFF